jgi:predicted nucleic acid-binding Zn ribbon protein
LKLASLPSSLATTHRSHSIETLFAATKNFSFPEKECAQAVCQ